MLNVVLFASMSVITEYLNLPLVYASAVLKLDEVHFIDSVSSVVHTKYVLVVMVRFWD